MTEEEKKKLNWIDDHAIPCLKEAQERLEKGPEVNRSSKNAPLITATSSRIREALKVFELIKHEVEFERKFSEAFLDPIIERLNNFKKTWKEKNEMSESDQIFKIIEAMEEQGFTFMLAGPQPAYPKEKWRAVFLKKWWSDKSPYEWEFEHKFSGEGETAQEAVLKAYRKSLGEEV